ncbi:2774_t:CDS:2, partial [Gigaspora margarita]
IGTYSNREDVKAGLGVNSSLVHQFCNTTIGVNFIYSGDADYVRNWFGVEVWSKALQWSGTEGFNDVSVTRWITANTGNYSGDVRTFKGFTLLKFSKQGIR